MECKAAGKFVRAKRRRERMDPAQSRRSAGFLGGGGDLRPSIAANALKPAVTQRRNGADGMLWRACLVKDRRKLAWSRTDATRPVPTLCFERGAEPRANSYMATDNMYYSCSVTYNLILCNLAYVSQNMFPGVVAICEA